MCALTQCTIAGAKGGAVGAGTGGGGVKCGGYAVVYLSLLVLLPVCGEGS